MFNVNCLTTRVWLHNSNSNKYVNTIQKDFSQLLHHALVILIPTLQNTLCMLNQKVLTILMCEKQEKCTYKVRLGLRVVNTKQ